MSEKLIEEKLSIIYEKCLPIYLKDIDEKYHEEVKECYYNYISKSYHDLLLEDIEDDDIERGVKIYIKIEEDSWKDKGPDDKLCLLIRDEYLTKIEEMHGKIIQAVHETVKTGKILTDEEGYRNFFRKSIEYLPKVREFNKELAITLLEDAHYGIKCIYGKIGQKES